METTPILGARLLAQSQSQKEITVNEALCRLEVLQSGLVSRALSVPPVIPTPGAAYIVAAGASGVWAGKDRQIAYYLAGWQYIAPQEGMRAWVKDESAVVVYNGSAWNLAASGGTLAGSGNALVNGAFSVWQRGTGFSSPAGTFTADRWTVATGTGGTALTTRQAFALGQTDVPGEPAFFLRHAQSVAAGSAPAIAQKIESVRRFAGQTVTLSFYARASAACTLSPALVQSFGSGGSASVTQTMAALTVGTGWARWTATATLPSLSGKTLGGGGGDAVQLKLSLPAGLAVTLDLCLVQLEAGATATAFAAQSAGADLLACQRYYEKSFTYATAPAQATTASGACYFAQTAAAGVGMIGTSRFAVPKRAVPSVTIYASAGGSGQAYNHSRATSDTSTAVSAVTEQTLVVSCIAAAGSALGDQHSFQFTADAEW